MVDDMKTKGKVERGTSASASASSDLLSNALGSATAGFISRLLTHPLDTAKARLQAPMPIPTPTPTGTATGAGAGAGAGIINPPYRGVRDVLIRTYKAEGVISLYRGFGAIVVGGTPGTMTYLCSYEWIKHRLTTTSNANNNDHHKSSGSGSGSGSGTSNNPLPEFVVHFTAGMLAETIACIIYVPVDVIKERLQVQQRHYNQQQQQQFVKSEPHTKYNNQVYNGSLDALKKILRHEGLGGIYKGYGATLASFGPFSAFYFLFYEQMKSLSKDYYFNNHRHSSHNVNSSEVEEKEKQGDDDLPFSYVVLCSAGAGASASWITSPLDMAKLRLQIQRGASASTGMGALSPTNNMTNNHHGMVDCLSGIYKQGGIRGLFQGAGARVIHFTPATMITMTCFEKCRSFFQTYV